ncbi:hypothetical protein D3C80_1927670 [compost metagenome]
MPGPCVPAVDIRGEEKELQQQAGIELDLEKDNREQRDVNQAERVVADLLQTCEPNAEQPRQGADSFNP